MKFAMKLWLWIFEFRIKRVPKNEKIEFLTRELLSELESQGYSLMGIVCGHLTIWIHDNDAEIENSHKNWRIKCGNYQPQIKE